MDKSWMSAQYTLTSNVVTKTRHLDNSNICSKNMGKIFSILFVHQWMLWKNASKFWAILMCYIMWGNLMALWWLSFYVTPAISWLSGRWRFNQMPWVIYFSFNFRVQLIGLGNGTACRETESWLKNNNISTEIPIIIVPEQGASIYSISKEAQKVRNRKK